MSKMGQELEKRLDENKYELLDALKYIIRELDKAGIIKADSVFMSYPQRVIGKIEGDSNVGS